MSVWRDYTHRGMWTHSILFEGEKGRGVAIGTCFPKRRDQFGPVLSVSWEAYDLGGDEDEGEASTKREAK